MQRKTWYSILGLDAMPLSLKKLLLSDVGSRKNPEFVEIFPTAVRGQLNVCRNVVLFGSL